MGPSCRVPFNCTDCPAEGVDDVSGSVLAGVGRMDDVSGLAQAGVGRMDDVSGLAQAGATDRDCRLGPPPPPPQAASNNKSGQNPCDWTVTLSWILGVIRCGDDGARDVVLSRPE